MTATHALDTGDRFLDTRGQCWTVLDTGQLQNDLAPGVLIRSWDSLDTCLGPLVQLREHEPGPLTPGDTYRDTLTPLDDEGPELTAQSDDMVNHPPHYTNHPSGVECITVTEHMNFCIGNAMKYLWRAGEKGDKVEDLRKASFYIQREIARLEDAA